MKLKQNLSFILYLLTVAALLTNVACSSKLNPVETPEKEREVENRGTPTTTEPTKVSHSFHCSHKIGSTTSAEDTIKLTYKIGTRVMIDYTITTEKNGGYTIDGSGITPSMSGTADTLELCWGEEYCLVMKKNKDRTWTIESLPFVK